MHSLARAALLAALGSLIAAGCGKKAIGDACSQGQSACLDERTGLFCAAGRFASMTCLGPAGCQRAGKDDVACDNPVASVGDGCNQPKDAACTQDRTQALVCTGERFVVAQPCKGPRGCMVSGETVYCDNALASPGDLCTEEGDAACRSDHTAFMKCVKGRFEVTNACRGPKRCVVTEKPEENKEQFECDDSITAPGDPCEDEGETSCGADLRSLDTCKAHKVALSLACPKDAVCAFSPAKARFDCVAPKKK